MTVGMTGPSMAGQCVLVTGAANGIGRTTSELLHRHGATVVLADRDTIGGAAAAEALAVRARFVALDVTSEEQWGRAMASVAETGLRLTALVNCAGVAARAPIADTSLATFRRMLEVNLVGTFLGIRAAAEYIDDGGSIVNFSSLRGVVATAELAAYGASKAGVLTLTRVAALELADRRIRVNAICPGSIDTAIADNEDFGNVDWEAYVQSIPLRRRGTVDEVAALVLFLCSDQSAYITGTDLLIDGGTAAGRLTPVRP